MLTASSSLQALGFPPAQIFPACLATGRLVVPVQFGAEQVYFFIDTGTHESVVLSLPFAESHGFLVLGRQRLAARGMGQPQVPVADVICPPFEALGRYLTEGQVSAYDAPRYTLTAEHGGWQPIAGSFGLGFFSSGALGLDFQHPAVAFTDRLTSEATGLPLRYDLSLSRAAGGLLFLEDIHDAITDRPLRVYFDSGALTSALSYDTAVAGVPNDGFLNRLLRWALRWRYHRNVRRTERRIQWSFDFGGQSEVRLGVWLVSSLKGVAAAYHLDRVDGWLGTDIIQSGVAVIDFVSMRVRVFEAAAGVASGEA